MDNDIVETNLEIIEQDIIAQQAYIDKVYSRRVPPPKKGDTSFWGIVGIDASLFTLTAIAGAVLSSIRTGGLFYILEQELLKEYQVASGMSGLLSTASLVTSLVAFEGFLLGVGFTTGRRNNKVKISKFGVILAFVVVLSAGVFSGLGIVDVTEQVKNIINIVLAIVTAVGATFITYFGGENIGYSFAIFENRKKEIETEFQEEYNNWNEGAIKSYQSSRYNIRSKNYIANKIEDQQKEEVEEVKKDQEPETYHYVTDFKNKYTNEEIFEKFWKQGRASLKKEYPNLSSVQESRWWSNVERDLIDAGYLEYENGSGNTKSKEDDEDENW